MAAAKKPARRVVPACALQLLKLSEGLHDGDRRTPQLLEPQADPIGIYTVGWGYALFEGGRPVTDLKTAMRIWRERWPAGMGHDDADQLLAEAAQDVCDRLLATLPQRARRPNDHQLGALVSLAYNIGVGEFGGRADFADSTLRKKYVAGDLEGAANAFRSWIYAGGKILLGLKIRRERERTLFLTPVAG